jgi:hypothetical protein
MAETSDLVEWLQNIRCDREPFAPGHAQCVCRLAHAAAARLEALEGEVERLMGAISKTVDENGHLADGDVCTLRHLTRALEFPRLLPNASRACAIGAAPVAQAVNSDSQPSDSIGDDKSEYGHEG